jgi:hypothetical protein
MLHRTVWQELINILNHQATVIVTAEESWNWRANFPTKSDGKILLHSWCQGFRSTCSSVHIVYARRSKYSVHLNIFDFIVLTIAVKAEPGGRVA